MTTDPESAPEPLRTAGPPRDRQTVPNVVGVHLHLEHEGRILLGLRHPDSPFAPLHHHHFLAVH